MSRRNGEVVIALPAWEGNGSLYENDDERRLDCGIGIIMSQEPDKNKLTWRWYTIKLHKSGKVIERCYRETVEVTKGMESARSMFRYASTQDDIINLCHLINQEIDLDDSEYDELLRIYGQAENKPDYSVQDALSDIALMMS